MRRKTSSRLSDRFFIGLNPPEFIILQICYLLHCSDQIYQIARLRKMRYTVHGTAEPPTRLVMLPLYPRKQGKVNLYGKVFLNKMAFFPAAEDVMRRNLSFKGKAEEEKK